MKTATFCLSFLLILSLGFLFFLFIRAAVPETVKTFPAVYDIRIEAVEKDFLSHLRVGDSISDSVTKEPLGVVSALYFTDTEREAVKDGVLMKKTDPRYSDVTLRVSLPLTKELTTKGGIPLRAGKTLYLRMPLYEGTGICLGVSENQTPEGDES